MTQFQQRSAIPPPPHPKTPNEASRPYSRANSSLGPNTSTISSYQGCHQIPSYGCRQKGQREHRQQHRSLPQTMPGPGNRWGTAIKHPRTTMNIRLISIIIVMAIIPIKNLADTISRLLPALQPRNPGNFWLRSWANNNIAKPKATQTAIIPIEVWPGFTVTIFKTVSSQKDQNCPLPRDPPHYYITECWRNNGSHAH